MNAQCAYMYTYVRSAAYTPFEMNVSRTHMTKTIDNNTYYIRTLHLVESKQKNVKIELTGIFVGNFIRIAADSSSGEPKKVKNFSKKKFTIIKTTYIVGRYREIKQKKKRV